MIIDSQYPRTNQVMEVKIVINQYIKSDCSGMEYSTGGKQPVEDFQRKMIESTNILLLC